MQFATLHQDRLMSLAVSTSPATFLVVSPAVRGFVQHVLSVPWARAWVDCAMSLGHSSHP